ncbi:MAG: tripartite tricarboxylate transporter substrate binding protein, partial [Actinobacteria bacterium]|nr:tripartite tricarboxylate transporter substrate binding protein [Actinomycetota bacterium]
MLGSRKKHWISVLFYGSSVFGLSTSTADVSELVAYVKRQPAGLNFASASSGGGAHIAGEMFEKAANLKLVHVPHKGSGPARTDLIAGHISLM